MTTQALPSFDTALADQVQHTKNAEAKARDWQAVADTQREEIDALAKDYRDVSKELDALHSRLDEAQFTIAALERRLAEAQQGLTVAEGG